MAYCTQADVEVAAGGEEALVQLTDLDSAGAVNEANVTSAIALADAWINSYVGKLRSVPLATTPVMIKRISAQETVYLLRSDRLAVSELDQRTHEQNERWLEGVAAGRITLGVDPQPAKSALVAPRVLSRDDDDDAELTISSLQGFW